MRVLLVTHRYLPAHRAGTELYVHGLARALRARGHDAIVATAEKDVSRAELSWTEREVDGVPVHALTRNLLLDDFRQTWDDERVDARFAQLLERTRPDVVHVHHLLYLSSGILSAARAAGAKVVFTAHDFWLECPRLGQLVHADGALCEVVDHARCGTCLPSYAWRQPRGAGGIARALAGLRARTGLDLGPVAARVARRVRPRGQARPAADESHRFADAAAARAAELRARVPAAVQHTFTPSRFLRERLVAWGLDPARVEHLPTGVDRARFVRRAARAPGPLRALFLGSLVPLKGAHVLLDAWGRLDAGARRGATLALHGPHGGDPDYRARLERRAREVGATLGSALDRDGVARALSAADVLVVPGLWFENRPLVMLEALATGVALVASDLGAAPELCVPGETGWCFPPGDADALAARLAALCADPGQADALPGATRALVPDEDEVVARILSVYRGLVGDGEPGRG